MIRLVPRRLRSLARPDPGRIPFLVGIVALSIVVIGVAWIVITGLLARSSLDHVRSELRSLRHAIASGNTSKAKMLVSDITRQAGSAHALTSGPVWWVASNIPVLGSPLQTSRTIAREADHLGQGVLPGILRLADDLAKTPPPANSTIDLAPIADAAPVLRSAARAAHAAVVAVDGAKPSWLSWVSSARGSVSSELHKLDGDLTGASRAVDVALPMLGQTGKQRYFIGFLNEAESRGVGGIPGAFAIATADHGRITFKHFGSDDDLHGVRADVHLGADFTARYKQDDPAGVFQNSDISPDFRDAGQIWAGMWEKKSGEHIDGALAIDPTAFSYLLKITGPASLPDGTRVSGTNVVSLTQQKQYSLYPGNTRHDKVQRKAFLNSVAKAVSIKLTQGGNAQRLIKAMSHASRERRLVVWSARPDLEVQLEKANWAGAFSAPSGTPVSGFIVDNAAGSKLDYYLDRSLTYQRAGCGASGLATVTFTLTNDAPRTGLPPYVAVRADNAPPNVKPGDNLLLVTYYATSRARIASATVDGKPLTVVPVHENGFVAATFELELPVQKTRTVQVRLDEPAALKPVWILRQPLVRPLAVTLRGDVCG